MAMTFRTSQDDALTRTGSLNPHSSFTVFFHLRNDGTTPSGSTFRQPFVYGDLTGTVPYLDFASDFDTNDIGIDLYDGSTFYFVGPVSLTSSTWYALAMVYDASARTTTLYVDGIAQGSQLLDLSTVTFSATDEFAGEGTFKGYALAHLRTWQAALTPTQLAAEAASPIAVRRTNLLTDTPLPSASSAFDQSGNGHDWTILGVPTNLDDPYAPPNQSFATAIALGTLPQTVYQRADFGGSTKTLYYSLTAAQNMTGAWGFGDLSIYKPRIEPFDVSETQILGIGPLSNRPIQFPTTAAQTYYVSLTPNGGNPSPAVLTLNVQSGPTAAAVAGSFAVNDDLGSGYPLTFLSSTVDYTVLRFIQPFPFGEAGDTLIDGTVLVEDTDHTGWVLYNSRYQVITSATGLGTLRMRTCLGANAFYVGINSNPTKFFTVSPDGTASATTTLTAMTSMSALAANNAQTILYHAFTPTGAAIRMWNIGGGAGSNLAAGIANYVVVDILVLGDDSIVVGYYKSSVTRDYQVKRYNAAGTTLNTYTFATPNGATAPRLAYAIDDPTSFWVYTHPVSTPGTANFINVNASDGTALVTRLQEEFEAGMYGGAETATPNARFGMSVSCPFWIVRGSVGGGGSGRRGIYVPTRGVAGSEGGGSSARFSDLGGSILSGPSLGTVAGRVVHLPPDGPIAGSGNGGSGGFGGLGHGRAIYVPPNSEGDPRDVD